MIKSFKEHLSIVQEAKVGDISDKKEKANFKKAQDLYDLRKYDADKLESALQKLGFKGEKLKQMLDDDAVLRDTLEVHFILPFNLED